MTFIQRHRRMLIGLSIVLAISAFLAFRPDKLFVDDAVDESLADAFASQATSQPTAAPVTGSSIPDEELEIDPPPVAETVTTTTEPSTAAPALTARGTFYGIDHAAAGTAAVYEQDGRYVLRFEDDTDIQNGPDLFVWVLPEGDYDGGDPSDYLDLGQLKGNIGGQNYELPDEYDPDIHQSVLIWCVRFGVPFAAVPLG